MFTRNSKKVKSILLVIFFLSSGLGIVLSITNSYQFFRAAAAQTGKAQPEPVNFSSPAVRGFGILGDSNSDEYQADDRRGGRQYRDVTFNWMEQLVMKRGLNFGPWGTWGEPRRTGYKYNWARSAATPRSMIASGQHLGLAQQIAAGEVSHVLIWIGGNEFIFWNGSYQDIYWGKLNDTELEAKVKGMIDDITLAVDTLLDAGEVQIVIVTLGDVNLLPGETDEFPNEARRQRVSDAIAEVNQGIRDLAETRGIEVVESIDLMWALLEYWDGIGHLRIGGAPIQFSGRSNNPHYLRLDDSVGHMGSVGSALLANVAFIEPFNRRYGLNIKPLSEEEFLTNTGIEPAVGSPNYWAVACLFTALVAVFVLANHGNSLPSPQNQPVHKQAEQSQG